VLPSAGTGRRSISAISRAAARCSARTVNRGDQQQGAREDDHGDAHAHRLGHVAL